MISPIIIGLIAAGVVTAVQLLHASFPLFWLPASLILGVAAIGMLFQKFVIDRQPGYRGYDGLADLLIHIHSPATFDSSVRWLVRGILSFLLTLCGGIVGPEGASVEFSQAFAMSIRARSSRWFEQRRRTDAACALAAGISAAFGAPFAAMLVPTELGIGGRTISVALSSLSAFLGLHYVMDLLMLSPLNLNGALYGFRLPLWREWIAILFVAVASGLASVFIIRFIRYTQDSLMDLFQRQAWIRIMAGGILLFLVAAVFMKGHQPPWKLFEDILWSRKSLFEVWVIFAVGLLGLAVVLAGFGTIGVFWPLFALGSFFGWGVNQFLLPELRGFSAVAGLVGASCFWAGIFGTPFAGAVLAFELTQNIHVLFTCLVAALIAREVRKRLWTRALMDWDLQSRGVLLVEGRSSAVLESILVKDAMIGDHETVHEQEPVSELYVRLLQSKYPFLPVVNPQGTFLGLLTADMVQEAWQTQGPATSHSSLAKLLEAKDLLYRSGFKTPTVKANDKLSMTTGMFEDVPCIPVLGDDGRVLGLLFVHNVRLAYDREVARRSLSLKGGEQV